MRGRKKAEATINSFNRLVLFDQPVIIDRYIEGIMDQIRSLARQAETTANGVADASAQLSSAAEQTGSATQGITDVSQQVAKGTAEQTESAKQTVESIRQLSGAMDQIAKGTQERATAWNRHRTKLPRSPRQ